MKRPWLLTPKGQRTALHIANVLSLVLFLGFALNFSAVELPRTRVQQLDTGNVSYCEIASCPRIQGLELTNGSAAIQQLEEKAFGYQLTLDFTNHKMLEGERELWLKVEHADGRILEMASTVVELNLKSRTTASFLLLSDASILSGATVLLGY